MVVKMIKLGIHLIVIFHDFAPKIFKRFFLNLIEKFFYLFKNKKILKKLFFNCIIFFINYFFSKFYNVLEVIFYEENKL